LAGRFIQLKGKTYEGLAKLLLAGAVMFFIAWCWNFTFPINKKLWTSSFVLHTVGLDCMILAAVIYIIDFLGKIRWTNFFKVFGKNPLFIYLLSELGVTLLFVFHASDGTSLFRWTYKHIYQYAGMYF